MCTREYIARSLVTNPRGHRNLFSISEIYYNQIEFHSRPLTGTQEFVHYGQKFSVRVLVLNSHCASSECSHVHYSKCSRVHYSKCSHVHYSKCSRVHYSKCSHVHYSKCSRVHYSKCSRVHYSKCSRVHYSKCSRVHYSKCSCVQYTTFIEKSIHTVESG